MFPSLRTLSKREINLNSYAADWLPRNGYPLGKSKKSAALDPVIAQRMIANYHLHFGVGFSYGGYGEGRSAVLKGSYLEKGKKWSHLGIDFHVPAGTPVEVDFPGKVVDITADYSEGGWGWRFMYLLSSAPIVLIYAHLQNISYKVGTNLVRGDVFAEVGEPDRNGGWWPHLHVQAMTLEAYREFEHNPDGLDGYGKVEDWPVLQKKFPNPTPYIRF